MGKVAGSQGGEQWSIWPGILRLMSLNGETLRRLVE